ncbi:MAG: hypothetical protein O9296_17320 [Novosphingobium sp.]|jgi:hypothetical protein|nr:hypothetical protein [Novosphingobium sp.]
MNPKSQNRPSNRKSVTWAAELIPPIASAITEAAVAAFPTNKSNFPMHSGFREVLNFI